MRSTFFKGARLIAIAIVLCTLCMPFAADARQQTGHHLKVEGHCVLNINGDDGRVLPDSESAARSQGAGGLKIEQLKAVALKL